MRSTGHLVLFAALLPTSALLVSAIKPALKSHGPALTALRHATPTSPTRARKPLLQQAAQLEGGGRGPRSVVLAAAAAGGSTSAKATTLNLAKNIVGSGILALAAGVAAFSGAKTAVLPAVGLLFSLGAASGYSFNLIARVGQEVGTDTYRDTWAKIFGTRFAIIPALTIMFKTIVGGLCYAIILGDSFAAIAALAGAPKALLSSNAWIGVLSAFVLLPLCLLRDLSSLAIGSVIGTAGTIYTALFMWKRLFDGSYAAGGRFHEAIPLAARPSFTPVSAAAPLFNARIFVLVSMLATAFLAHYNAPKYFQELETPADGTSKEASFRKVCVGGFGIAAALMSLVISGGYLTFGSASQGLILNNYATADTLAFVARLGTSASILFSYPLNFVGLRDQTLSLLGLKERAGETGVHVLVTLALMLGMNGLALVTKDLGIVVALGGAVLGTALVYIMPALMFIQATRQKEADLTKVGLKLPKGRRREMYLNGALAALGASLGGLGAFMVLSK